MAVIVDAGPLIALVDKDDGRHSIVRTFFDEVDEPLFISPFVLVEADYVVAQRFGVDAELRLLTDIARGTITIDRIDEDDMVRCLALVRRYRDLNIQIADASICVLADRHNTRRVATFDERHFRTLRNAKNESFVLLPSDELGAGGK